MLRSRLAQTFILGFVVAFAVSLSTSAASIPRLKPDRPHVSGTLSDADFRRLARGFEAAETEEWGEVKALEGAMTDPVAAMLLRWRRATEAPVTRYGEIRALYEEFRTWPRADLLQRHVEEVIGLEGLSDDELYDWFEVHPPISGEGLIARGEARIARGETDRGRADIREAWHYYALSREAQARALSRHGFLTREDHEARVDLLLWRGYYSRARELYGKIGTRFRSLADAREKLGRRSRGVNSAIERVHPTLKEHPGLLYERAKWRRRAGRADEALPLLLAMPEELPSDAAAREIWDERRLHIGYAIKDRRWRDAYTLAYRSNLTRGADFADAEFVSGWLALRKLDKPAVALEHFERLRDGVSTPISTARAHFWVGEALRALERTDEANNAYQQAASYPITFYGQMAATRLGAEARSTSLPPEIELSTGLRTEFRENPQVKALLLLRDLDEPNLFDIFITHLDDEAQSREEIALLSDIAARYGRDRMMVRVAKTGLGNNLVSVASAYPVRDLPRVERRVPEPALVLALIRQESEFSTAAISSANARGLMQLLPATAAQEARLLSMPYETSWLTADPDYNITLGSLHLQGLIERFDGSYIMAIAAYNAGASRVNRWIEDYGDPRSEEVDVLDWLESIPFSETRNYVQRVMENVLMYRARLNGGSATITLDADITRGRRES